MKRILALVLALTILLSAFATGAAAATNYSSLAGYSQCDEYASVTIDVVDESELAGYYAGDLVSAIERSKGKTYNASTIVWSKEGNDNYTVTSVYQGQIDLSSKPSEMNVILGNGKQLDYANNTRIRVRLYYNYVPVFSDPELSAPTTSDSYPENQKTSSYVYSSGMECHEVTYYPEITEELTLFLRRDDRFSDYDLTFYDGRYASVEEIEASGATPNENAYTTEGYGELVPVKANQYNYYTIIFDNGEHRFSRILRLYVYARVDSISRGWLNTTNGVSAADHSSTTVKDGVWITTYTMKTEYSADAEYYYYMNFYDGKTGSYDNSRVEYAYVDGAEEDIKAELFDNGYLANYSGDGHSFEIKIVDGAVYKYQVKAIDEESEPEPEPDDPVVPDPEEPEDFKEPLEHGGDTYFQAKTVLDENGERVATYTLPYGADSLYRSSENCYQSILLMPNTPLDETQMIPVFAVREGTEMYAQSVGTEAAVKQESGVNVVDFSKGAVEYTAKDASGSSIKNYWVNFAQKQADAALFVNGPTFDEVQTGEVDEIEKREVLLCDENDLHDVFIANLGNTELTGLTVTLDAEAQKTLALDEYFTVGGTGNDTLPAFNDNNPNYNKAAAKIRLRLKDAPENLNTDRISGLMTIASDAGTKYIYLTGLIIPKIITSSVPAGVKYVPYSIMLQTSNHDDSNTVTFGLTEGKLPSGIELNTVTGEIYGVPTETGMFHFTVSAANSLYPTKASYKDYTLVVDTNSDQMVNGSCDDIILNYVQNMGNYRYENSDDIYEYAYYVDQVFEMDHEFDEFVKFFLDGEELVLGTDYYAEEGSTKVTILKKTFQKAGNGTHTIAAEFRDPSTNEMYKNAQNYTANVRGNSSGGSSSNKQEQPKQESIIDDGKFIDVKTGDWFHDDVYWAKDNGYMVGVSSNRFAPNNMISLPMVVTTLARMNGVDLQKYAANQYLEKYSDIPAGMWFSEAAVWAREVGLLTDEQFQVEPPLGRAEFAVILAKYLKHIGVETVPATKLTAFADADLMTAEENSAFQMLHYYGVFNGIGNNRMDPDGDTTRAQLAALLHRLSSVK